MKDVIEAVKWQESLLSDNTDASTGGKKEPKQATPPSESSLTSQEGNVSRSRPPTGKGKAKTGVSEKDRRLDDSGLPKRSSNDKTGRRRELASNGFDEPDSHRNQPVRDLYTQSASPRTQRFMQRPVYLPGGSGQEVHAVPMSPQAAATLPSHARLNSGGMPGMQQDLHNQSFGIYGESDHEGGGIRNGYGYTNGPSLYSLGEIPQGLPAHHLPGNRYPNGQDYSMFPQNVPGKPSTSSPNSHTLSPPGGLLSREPSPIRSPDMSSIHSRQQSPPMRPYKSMFDVRQPLNEETGIASSNPLSLEYSSLNPPRPNEQGDNMWMSNLQNLQHGRSEPMLDHLAGNPTSSSYNDILENLSSLRVQSSNSNHEGLGSYDYNSQLYPVDTNQSNPQAEYYQRLLGTDRSDLEHLSSDHFHDRSPYDLSILSARSKMQKQQQRRLQARHTRLPPRKIPPTRKAYIDERTPPELLDHAGALPPEMTPLDILEYELAADKEYLAEEIADEKYQMEKEHQAMIDSLFSEQVPEEELGQNRRKLYDLNGEQNGSHLTNSYDRKSKADPQQRVRKTNPMTSTSDPSRHELVSPPGTPPLPEILSSPPYESGDDNWNLFPTGAHNVNPNVPLTMRELDDLDDTHVPSRRPGENSSLPNGHSLAPLTDRLKEYFEDGEPSESLEYEKLLEEAQRNR